jgi:hypothetical protein
MPCGWKQALREILTPGKAEFKARVAQITEEQSRLLQTLHLLEQPAMRDVTAATDRAAEFR